MSPIRGLTHREASFPLLGAIRKGAPKKPDRPGEDLTYFRVEFDEQEQDAAEKFASAYPDEPRELNILLPFNDVDHNFQAWNEAYVRGGLLHRCDGDWVEYEVDPRSGDPLVLNGQLVDGGGRKACTFNTCKPSGRLKVIIPELARLAFLMFRTGSKHDIINIHSQLTAYLQITGALAGIPLILKRKPYEISTPSSDSPSGRARRTKWLVSLEANPDWVAARLEKFRLDSFPVLALGDEQAQLEVAEGDFYESDEEVRAAETRALDEKARTGIKEPPDAPEEQESSNTEGDSPDDADDAQGQDGERSEPVEAAEGTITTSRVVLAPAKVKAFIWRVIEEAQSVPPMSEEHRLQIIELIGEQLTALENVEDAGQAASDVFFYLTDTRIQSTTPDIVWNAIRRWLNIKFVQDGMEIGSEAARQEIGAIWRETCATEKRDE